jgi:hypothetical protein
VTRATGFGVDVALPGFVVRANVLGRPGIVAGDLSQRVPVLVGRHDDIHGVCNSRAAHSRAAGVVDSQAGRMSVHIGPYHDVSGIEERTA